MYNLTLRLSKTFILKVILVMLRNEINLNVLDILRPWQFDTPKTVISVVMMTNLGLTYKEWFWEANLTYTTSLNI